MSGDLTLNFVDLFKGKLVKAGKEFDSSELAGKTVILYFSAHWCGPCRGFTPTLINAYNAAKEAGAEFELVFISADMDDEGFNEYYGTMPWVAVKFDEEDLREQISSQANPGGGIPSLQAFNKEGKRITDAGRQQVASEKAEAIKAWAKQ